MQRLDFGSVDRKRLSGDMRPTRRERNLNLITPSTSFQLRFPWEQLSDWRGVLPRAIETVQGI